MLPTNGMQLARMCFLAVLVACGGSNNGIEGSPDAPYSSFGVDGQPLNVELRTSPSQPPERGAIRATLKVTDANGAPRDGLAIDVVPWMTAHGHGSSVVPVVTPSGGGVYSVDQLDLAMPGTWQLRLAFKDAELDAHATTTIDVR